MIANAPNPAGQALLNRFFGDGISPGKLMMGALIPTVIVSLVMLFFPDPTKDAIFEKGDAKPNVEMVEDKAKH